MTNKNLTHTIQFRVYYEDTDAADLMYHANHLKFAERGRTEMLRAAGFDHKRVKQDFNLVLIVRRIEIDYQGPARLDDLLTVQTEISAMGNSSLTMTQTILKEDKVLAILKVVVVAISPESRAVRIPPQLRQIFSPSSEPAT